MVNSDYDRSCCFVSEPLIFRRFINENNSNQIKEYAVDHPCDVSDKRLLYRYFAAIQIIYPDARDQLSQCKSKDAFQQNKVQKDDHQEHAADGVKYDPQMILGLHQPDSFYQVCDREKDHTEEYEIQYYCHASSQNARILHMTHMSPYTFQFITNQANIQVRM